MSIHHLISSLPINCVKLSKKLIPDKIIIQCSVAYKCIFNHYVSLHVARYNS